jgi:hypothetical protein
VQIIKLVVINGGFVPNPPLFYKEEDSRVW